ncbi:MAG: DNA-directed RNA polymerase subunit alpha [Patescibacteria group bacterium]|jgi:DNA-directed RNA polymerase subunit alpha
MSQFTLPETALMKYEQTKREGNSATFEIEPLSPGFGVTIGNALRRVLLSSLEGAAISAVKFEEANHEFSTIAGIKEDIVEIILNLKKVNLKLHGDEKTILSLSAKGPKEIKASDFTANALVEITNPNQHIATLDKGAKLEMEVVVEKGRGYAPVEKRVDEKLPLGNIAIDCIFSPVTRVNFNVENTRVGGMTNFDKLTLEIITNGIIDPEDALKQAARILVEHYGLISGDLVVEEESLEVLEDEQMNSEQEIEKAIEEDLKPVKKTRKSKTESDEKSEKASEAESVVAKPVKKSKSKSEDK